SEGSHLEARGNITDLKRPVVQGDYDLFLDLPRVAAIARQTRLRSGLLHLQGRGSWSREGFGTDGKFDVKDASWQAESVAAKNASAAGQFSLDPKRFAVSQVEGRIFRGSFSSEAEILGWRLSDAHGKNASNDPQRGTVNAKFKDVSLAEVLSNLGSQFRPVNGLKLAGEGSGTSQLRLKKYMANAEIGAGLAVQ